MFANPAREIFFWRTVTIQQIVTSANFTRYTVAISFVSRIKRKAIHVISLYEMGFKDINIISINDIYSVFNTSSISKYTMLYTPSIRKFTQL